ncbi:FtsQ-type POTRA domain-containing protein [bacterium]|nr:FtsQ-type POTRA domain-containing protein [bacterium]
MKGKSLKIGLIVIPLVILVSIIGAGIYLTLSPRFSISEIQIVGNNMITDHEILVKIPLLRENIFFIHRSYYESLIMEIPRIKHVRLKRHYPDLLVVYIKEKQPAVLLNFQEIYGLTEDCEPIPMEQPNLIPNLPVISGIDPGTDLIPYQPLQSENLAVGMAFLAALRQERSSAIDMISEIDVSTPESLKIYLMSDGLEVCLGSGSYQEKIENLMLVLNNLKSERELVRRINLSYDHCAVLTYNRKF